MQPMTSIKRLSAAAPVIELVCALIAAALWYTQGGAVWYTGGWPGAWPLAALVLGWVVYKAVSRTSLRPALRDVLLIVFAATALMGVWAAYDPDPAWAKFWLVIGALGLYYAFSHQVTPTQRYLGLAVMGVFGVLLAAYYYATNDWASQQMKVPFLITLGQQVSEHLPSLATHRMHPNVVGGMLATTLPFYVPLIQFSRQVQSRQRSIGALLTVTWVLAALFSSLTLVVTSSRGAWAAALLMFGMWVAWRMLGAWFKRRDIPAERIWRRRMSIFTVCIIAGVALVAGMMWLDLTFHLPGSGALSSRLDLLQNALLLARDYGFTGAGLGMFEMQYSTYTLLIHVPFIVHSHNLLLNVLIEQGLLGLLCFAGFIVVMLVTALRQLRRADAGLALVIEAALVAIGIILLHGQVDDAFYGSRGLLLIFAPFGLIVAAGLGGLPGHRIRLKPQVRAPATTLDLRVYPVPRIRLKPQVRAPATTLDSRVYPVPRIRLKPQVRKNGHRETPGVCS